MESDVVVRRAKVGTDHVILVEARSSGGSEEDVGVGDLLAFEGVEKSITTISQRVTAALKAANPDRASVEFGIDLAVESGGLTGLLAKASGAATLKVTLSWGSGDG
jgi:Trypsin-co-occurring domain 1